MTDLETRLRAELNAAAQDVRVSPDAWQRNQRLLAGNHVGRRARLTWLASAAAVVVAVAAGFTALSGNGDNPPAPPAGSDPFEDGGLLGTPVEVARLGSGPTQVRVEMAIADGKGSRPDMCTRFVTGPNSTSSCGGQSDDPENALVAFDYLSGSRGSTISVEGAVDTRVASVRAWLSDGTEVRPRLVPLGAEELSGFAVPTAKDHPYAVRLAAYASDGTALEYVNLATRFGADWIPAGDAPVSGCPADIDCTLDGLRPGLIAKVIRGKDSIVVLVWPEVRTVTTKGSSAETGLGSPESARSLITAVELIPETLDAAITVTASDDVNSAKLALPATQ